MARIPNGEMLMKVRITTEDGLSQEIVCKKIELEDENIDEEVNRLIKKVFD